jgi:uncharacterized protein YcbK (DUF882 family)
MARRTLLPGYTRLGGTSKRVRTPSGSIISDRAYNLISSYNTNAIKAFEIAAAHTRNEKEAIAQSGISKRQLDNYRRSFEKGGVNEGRYGASPWKKEGNRLVYHEPMKVSYGFIADGKLAEAEFSGLNLIKVQDYRNAREKGQEALNEWARKNPDGVTDINGKVHHPETSEAGLRSAYRRMSKKDKARYRRMMKGNS